MKKINLYGLGIVLLSVSSCHHAVQPINKASWFIGTWECTTPEGSLYESWHQTSPEALAGKSYFLNGKDTSLFETVKLIHENNRLHYIVTTANQNNQQPVRFSSISITDNELVFENKEHDFPQIIKYNKISNDSIVAEISGSKNGKSMSELFPMKKMK